MSCVFHVNSKIYPNPHSLLPQLSIPIPHVTINQATHTLSDKTSKKASYAKSLSRTDPAHIKENASSLMDHMNYEKTPR